jgi:phosphoribosylformylglycinamidine cyclo-ligase
VASNGLHTNGYTLVRKLLETQPDLKTTRVDGEPFIDVVMRPHKPYYQHMRGLFANPGLKGMAHITGGGIQDNLNRILPPTLDAAIDLAAVHVPEVFKLIRTRGNVADADMLRTFNCGVGLTLVCASERVNEIVGHLALHGCEAYAIGEIVEGAKTVRYRGAVGW